MGSATLAGNAKSVKRQYVNFTGFHISFNAPSSASSKDPPREVELHVSSDQGVTWELAGTAKPSEQKILFRAPRDGEFWFMPRTKYASGRYLPGPPAPEMKVVVDTATPIVELAAQNDDGGEIVIRWYIADSHLKRESFKLEYKAATVEGKWQPISIDPVDASSPSGEIRGETTVVLPIREQSVEIIVRHRQGTTSAAGAVERGRAARPRAAAGRASSRHVAGRLLSDDLHARLAGRRELDFLWRRSTAFDATRFGARPFGLGDTPPA
jgi:hypothetical protein